MLQRLWVRSKRLRIFLVLVLLYWYVRVSLASNANPECVPGCKRGYVMGYRLGLELRSSWPGLLIIGYLVVFFIANWNTTD